MAGLDEAVADFLAQKRIAVAGVSRDRRQPANAIYRKLSSAGHEVFAVNPKTDRVEDAPCWPDLASIPDGVDAVVVATPSTASADVVREAARLGIRHVWIHRGLGAGSASDEAVAEGRRRGLSVIPGGCPMMFCPPVDVAHRCMRWLSSVTGKLPRQV